MKLFLLMILLSTITSSMSVNYCSRRERELEAVIGLAATCIDLTLCNNGGICPMFYLAVCGEWVMCQSNCFIMTVSTVIIVHLLC